MSTKAEYAISLHDKGYNCAQAVACTFCKEFGVDEQEMFKIAEGFGLGMGMMEMCGALSGMMMVIGLAGSVGDLKKGMPTKGSTYKQVKEQVQKFKEKNGSYLCRELKGVETGKVLCSCPQCIMDAVALTEEYLKEHQADTNVLRQSAHHRSSRCAGFFMGTVGSVPAYDRPVFWRRSNKEKMSQAAHSALGINRRR